MNNPKCRTCLYFNRHQHSKHGGRCEQWHQPTSAGRRCYAHTIKPAAGWFYVEHPGVVGGTDRTTIEIHHRGDTKRVSVPVPRFMRETTESIQ